MQGSLFRSPDTKLGVGYASASVQALLRDRATQRSESFTAEDAEFRRGLNPQNGSELKSPFEFSPVFNVFRRSADLFAVVPQCGTKEKALATVDQSALIRVPPWLKMVLNAFPLRSFLSRRSAWTKADAPSCPVPFVGAAVNPTSATHAEF